VKYQGVGMTAAKRSKKLKAVTEGFAETALKTLCQKQVTRAQVLSR